jgi:hypothetical protein
MNRPLSSSDQAVIDRWHASTAHKPELRLEFVKWHLSRMTPEERREMIAELALIDACDVTRGCDEHRRAADAMATVTRLVDALWGEGETAPGNGDRPTPATQSDEGTHNGR